MSRRPNLPSQLPTCRFGNPFLQNLLLANHVRLPNLESVNNRPHKVKINNYI